MCQHGMDLGSQYLTIPSSEYEGVYRKGADRRLHLRHASG